MHDLGGNRRAVDGERRRAEVGRAARLSRGAARRAQKGFTFLQISDSHIGFDKAANPHAIDTLRRPSATSALCRTKPAFMLHTGDITHLSKAGAIR